MPGLHWRYLGELLQTVLYAEAANFLTIRHLADKCGGIGKM